MARDRRPRYRVTFSAEVELLPSALGGVAPEPLTERTLKRAAAGIRKHLARDNFMGDYFAASHPSIEAYVETRKGSVEVLVSPVEQ